MPYVVREVPTPAEGDDVPHPWLVGVTEICRDYVRELYGHTDFVHSAEASAVMLRGGPTYRQQIWVAVDQSAPPAPEPSDVLGYIQADYSLVEDFASTYLDIVVRPDDQRTGIGSALLAHATAALPDRTTHMVYAASPDATGQPGAMTAKVGIGAVPGPRASSQFLLHHGFTLEQVERASTLTVDDEALARAAALGAEAAAQAVGYTTVEWTDRMPEEFLADMGDLHGHMSADIPTGDVAYDRQVWDADRIRDKEARARKAGYHKAWTAARHTESGQLVAFTELAWSVEHPDGVEQGDTLVRSDHRGHRLGMLVKTANLDHLRRVNPVAARIHTWNAEENGPMLDINVALGFRPVAAEGAWRRIVV